MEKLTKEMLIATETSGEEDIMMGIRIVIKEAAYSFKYDEGLVSEDDPFGGNDWLSHYEEGVLSSILFLQKHDEEEVAEVLLDEIRCEDLLEDERESEVLETIMNIIYKEA